MISRETENVNSRDEIENAFRALSAEGRPYVNKQELYAVSNHVTETILGLVFILIGQAT